MAYFEKSYNCGGYIEKERFSVPREFGNKPKKFRIPRDKSKKSTKEQENQNWKRAEKSLRRKANTNFKHGVDLYVTITSKTKKTLQEFSKMTKNFIERIRYNFKKEKKTLKYIYCFGEHKKEGVHAHMVISGMSFDKLVTIWEQDKDAGHIGISKLQFDNKDGIGGLMGYFIGNVKERINKAIKRGETINIANVRKFTPSKNLKEPKLTKKIIVSKVIRETPVAPKGYMIMDHKNTETSYGIYQFIQMIKITDMRN